MANNICLHIYPSVFGHESRILKETKSLVNSSLVDRAIIGAIWENGYEEYESIDGKREVWRLPLKTGQLSDSTCAKSIKHIEWILRIFFKFRKKHVGFVHCHNLSSLLAGVLFKLFEKSKVIYDAHELETEKIGWHGLRKTAAKVSERILIRYVDSIIVVSESIAEWYKDHYTSKNVCTIKNMPYHPKKKKGICSSLKENFNIQESEILYIYQGMLSKGRGIEILLNAFSKTDSSKHVVFMGYGPLVGKVKKFSDKFSNIHFHPAVMPDDVISHTQSADIGLSLIENTCLSYFYSLPNKVFEYIVSGLPLIVSNFPDMGRVIDENKCGWKTSVDEKSILDLVTNISKEDIENKRKNVLKCKDNFTWDNEKEKLLTIYRNLNN